MGKYIYSILSITLLLVLISGCLPPTYTPISQDTSELNCPEEVFIIADISEYDPLPYYPDSRPIRLIQDDFQLVYSSDFYDIARTRQDDFEDMLNISMDIPGISLYQESDYVYIYLIVTIKLSNVSSVRITVLEPDANILTTIKNGSDLKLYLTTDGIEKPFPRSFSTALSTEVPFPNSPEEFVIIESNSTYTASYLGYIGRFDIGYERLSPGLTEFRISYINDYIGYLSTEFSDIPEPAFDTMRDESDWWQIHGMYPDLNAWVGKIESEGIKFNIPPINELKSCFNNSY